MSSGNRNIALRAPDALSMASELGGTVTGTLKGLTPTGLALVDVSDASFTARSCVALTTADIGKDVVLAFDRRHPDFPIVVGVIQPATTESVEVTADGKDLILSAQRSVTLRCGEASISLSCDGKVVIRGAHVVSYASGVNRIRGGSVELN